jgi:hypothetical protein
MSYRTKHGKVIKAEQRTMTWAEFNEIPCGCGWDGCRETYKGDMPRGWVRLLTYWSPRPHLHFEAIPAEDMPRDRSLCPCHAQELESNLIPLCRLGAMPVEGTA